jgi:hypothetical protein
MNKVKDNNIKNSATSPELQVLSEKSFGGHIGFYQKKLSVFSR